jgi:hypothetical protein
LLKGKINLIPAEKFTAKMSNLFWRETRPGRWERPLSCLEKINLLNRNVDKARDRDNWAKTAVAKLEFSPSIGDPEEALRIAWKQVRYNYPEVAAFPYNDTYMYRIGNPEQVDLWVTATFSVAEKTTVDQLLGHIPRNEQMMCFYLPDTSEVLIRSPHYRLDARGAILCLNFLIESLANLDFELVFGGCAKNLSPSIDDALDIPLQYTPAIEKAAMKRLDALKPRNPPLNLIPSIKSKLPGATRRRFVKFSKSETRAVIAGCKDASLHYTTALHAALVNAVAIVASPSELKSFMASLHCDLRLLIQKPVTTKRAPTSCTSVLTTEVEVSPLTNFRSYYAQLALVYASGYMPYLESTACFHEKFADRFGKDKSSEEADGQPQPRFGTLGVVDDELQKEVGGGLVRVKEFWLGAEILTKRKMVHTWIWDDQMVFSCCYNESFWEDAFVETFLQAMKNTLIEEVALPSLLLNTQL